MRNQPFKNDKKWKRRTHLIYLFFSMILKPNPVLVIQSLTHFPISKLQESNAPQHPTWLPFALNAKQSEGRERDLQLQKEAPRGNAGTSAGEADKRREGLLSGTSGSRLPTSGGGLQISPLTKPRSTGEATANPFPPPQETAWASCSASPVPKLAAGLQTVPVAKGVCFPRLCQERGR